MVGRHPRAAVEERRQVQLGLSLHNNHNNHNNNKTDRYHFYLFIFVGLAARKRHETALMKTYVAVAVARRVVEPVGLDDSPSDDDR